MNLRQLQYFEKVVETGNFTHASRELHISQPALWQQIKMLEDAYGIELLLRHSRGVKPTPAGLILYQRAKAILTLLADTKLELRALTKSPYVKLRIGLVRSIIRQLGANLLLDAQDLMPNVMLHINEDFSINLLAAMRRNELDIAFVYHVDSDDGLELTPVLKENYVLVSPRRDGMPVGGDVTLKETLSYKLVFHAQYDFVRTALEEASAHHGLPLNIAFEALSSEALFETVGNGLADAIAPYGMLENIIRSGRAVARRIVDPEITRVLTVARPAKRANSESDGAIDQFIDRVCMRIQESVKDFSEPVNINRKSRSLCPSR